MANMHLVTGRAGADHVTSDDSGALNATIFGKGQYVLNEGNNLSASAISNNTIRVLDGCVMIQGRYARVDGNNVDLTIESGSQGYNRNDLIVARYTRDTAADVEECNLVVIKGTAVTGTASDPGFITGNLLDEVVIQVDMPLYRVPISGINVLAPVALFNVISENLASLSEKINHVNDKNNPHKVTCAQIGAAKADHTHTPASIGAATASHTHTPASIGAATASHTHKASEVESVATLDSNGRVEAEQTRSLIRSVDGSTYTLVASDAGKFLRSGTCTITVPYDPNYSIFPIGTEIELNTNISDATITLVSGSSDNIKFQSSSGIVTTLTTVGKFPVVAMKRMSETRWLVKGDVE